MGTFNAGYPSFHGAWQHPAAELPIVTTERIMQTMFWMSWLVVVAAVAGIAGALLRNRTPTCIYIIMASALSVVVLVSAAQTTQRRMLVGRMVEHQVDQLCNASTYMQLTSGLGCGFAATYAQAKVAPCDALCELRVEKLQKLEGCHILPHLCSTFRYGRLKGGGCFAAAAQNGWTVFRHMAPSTSLEACEGECNADIGCTTYIHIPSGARSGEQCFLIADPAAQHNRMNWTALAPASLHAADDAAGSCFRRTKPEVLVEFLAHNLHESISAALLGVVLLLSTACTCCILYDVSMSRKGLPTATELALMMFCPCVPAAERAREKYGDDYLDDLMSRSQESSSDSDEEKGSSDSGKK